MGWQIKKIGEVCDLMTGGTPSKSKPEYFDKGEIKWLVSGDIHQKEITDCNGRINEAGLENSNAKYLPVGSVMIALNGQGKTRGSVSLLRTIATCNQSMVSINPRDRDKLLPEFLYIYLHGRYEQIREMTGDGGNDRRGLNMPLIRSIEIPIPPMPEQKRIVAILDQVFADIDKARELTERNLKNARELFESYLQKVFCQRGEGWVEKTLGETVIVERGSSPRPIKNFQTQDEDGVNWVKIGDAKEGQKYIIETKEKITKKGAEKSRFVDVGDFILSNSMSFGRPYIMAIQGYIHDGWFVLRLPKDINSDYFYYLLTSPYIKKQFQILAAGAIVKNISGDLVKKAILPIPSIGEQQSIAKKLDKLSGEVGRLENLYQEKLKHIDQLKKSLLQKAFSGELTKDKLIANFIPFPTKIPDTNTTDLHAGILALAFHAHEEANKEKQFGHVKAEKIAHMVEAMVGIDLDREPIQGAAGPNDYPHFKKKVEPRAKKAGFFEFKGSEAKGYVLHKGSQFNKLVDKTRKALSQSNHLADVESLIQLMLKMNTEKAEIFATVYAAWNNLLLDKKEITDEAIVLAARENWHESKLAIPRKRFFDAIKWMRKQNLEPLGRGKYVR